MHKPAWVGRLWLPYQGRWVAPGTPQYDLAWYEHCIDAVPSEWRKKTTNIFTTKKKELPEREANLWLTMLAISMRKLCLPLSANDDDIIVMATKIADDCKAAMTYNSGNELDAYQIAQKRCALYNVTPPISKDGTMEQIRACIKRVCAAAWWRRALRVAHTRAIEAVAQRLGFVWLRAEKYVSEANFARRQRQRQRNADIMKRQQIENEEGVTLCLAEAAAASTSNPAIRRVELMTRCRGFEEAASERGDVPVFITVTCPSAWHRVLSISGTENPKWEGRTPRDAQQHLVECWARTRAKLQRLKIKPYGIRVAEPHHDGCPHWHLLLFVPKKHIKALHDTCRHYFLSQHQPDEKGAKENRVKSIVIKPERGTATGYIAKYISKNIDGMQVKYDLYGDDAIKGSLRVEAWASTWGIRQFQQIGGPPVTIWRELRRMKPSNLYTNVVELCRAAADRGSWCDYIKQMGGATCKRADLAIGAAKTKIGHIYNASLGKQEPAPRTQYGEISAPRLWGVRDLRDGLSFPSRMHRWFRVIKGSARRAEHPPHQDPWTRENNCTDQEEREEEEGDRSDFESETATYFNNHYA